MLHIDGTDKTLKAASIASSLTHLDPGRMSLGAKIKPELKGEADGHNRVKSAQVLGSTGGMDH